MQPQFRSQPALTAIAADCSQVAVTLWCSWKSLIAQQSLTTKPPKPHSSRRIFRSSVGLPEHGSPLVRLYAAMMLSAFASVMQASNAGRYVSRRSFSLTTASKLWRSPSGPLCTA